MIAIELEPLLLNQSGKYYCLYTYQNAWDPIKKRSRRVKNSMKKAGHIIVPGQKEGEVKWQDWFIARHPELKSVKTVRRGRGKFEFLPPATPPTSSTTTPQRRSLKAPVRPMC